MATFSEPMTLGMRLDAALESLDSLSSTQLYVISVTLMVVASFAILGMNPDMQATAPSSTTSVTCTPDIAKHQHKVSQNKPAWHGVFRAFNFAGLAAFLSSIAFFFNNAAVYSQDSAMLTRFLLGWSAYLGFFFSFSGISILYDMQDEEEDQAQQCSPAELQPQAKKCHVQPPAYSTPVCSDPASFKLPSSSKKIEDVTGLSNEAIAQLVLTNQLKDHELEKRLVDAHRAVYVRRLVIDAKLRDLGKQGALEQLPCEHSLDYGRVHGANCEIVVGYVPIPVGIVGPMTLNGESVFIPMATTEGCLVASTNRGAKAITEGGGAHAEVIRDGITRAPCVRMASAMEAAHLKMWCERPENFCKLKSAFESTTSFGKLKSCVPTVAGKNVYLRLTCFAGDAMGMNMISKGSLAVIETLKSQFPDLHLVALSGNMCTDKKAAATNWIEGRGKSVVVEAVIPANVVRKTLKTTVQALVHVNIQKNLIGSAMAGTIGGFNAHASNMVTAVFLATGQDPAQNVESSNCITLLEETDEGDLWISCTMPSLEVGTVGGGTSLPAQAACLKAIGCQGGGKTPGENAQQLAKVVAAATMAGELSLLAALAANTLVQAHMTHNRKPPTSSSK